MMVEVANSIELERTLLALRDMLAQYGHRQWAQGMHDLMCDWQEAKTKDARRDVAHRITFLYQGMGSFNDLCLNGGASVEAEDEFQRAQSRLYNLARSFR